MERFWRLKRGKGRKEKHKLRKKKKNKETGDQKLPTTLEDHPDKNGKNIS